MNLFIAFGITRSRHKNLRRFLATLNVIFDNWYYLASTYPIGYTERKLKLIRIGLIRINLQSLAVDDSSELSRS
jgi:hypothetical protein